MLPRRAESVPLPERPRRCCCCWACAARVLAVASSSSLPLEVYEIPYNMAARALLDGETLPLRAHSLCCGAGACFAALWGVASDATAPPTLPRCGSGGRPRGKPLEVPVGKAAAVGTDAGGAAPVMSAMGDTKPRACGCMR